MADNSHKVCLATHESKRDMTTHNDLCTIAPVCFEVDFNDHWYGGSPMHLCKCVTVHSTKCKCVTVQNTLYIVQSSYCTLQLSRFANAA